MTHVEQKKFIAGFLLLAVAVGASALVFSYFTPSPQASSLAYVSEEKKDATPQSAFYESIPQNSTEENSAEPESAQTNLTEKLIFVLGEELSRTNPAGPTIESGSPNLLSPNIEKIVATLSNDYSNSERLPDWEREIVFSNNFRTIVRPTLEDVERYNNAVNKILEKHFLANGLDVTKPDFGGDVDPRAFPFQKVAQELTALSVPEPLTGFHWSLVKLMNYESRVMALLDGAGEDPLKAAAILQAQEKNYFAAIQLLQNEAQKASTIRGFSYGKTPNSFFAQISSLFEIKTAHALFGIGDISFDPANLARMVWEFVRKIATEQLKTQLVHKLVAQTITWIQGGGKPQFITNWKGFLKDTAKLSIEKSIDRYYPFLCQSFGPLIRVALLPIDLSRETPPVCTIDQIVANVQEFADSFTNGGWIAYGAALEPSNNFFGSLIQTNEIIQQEAAAEQRAKKLSAIAGKGFTPTRECVKYGPSTGSVRGAPVLGPCLEWRDTTPGAVLAGIANNSFAAPLARIVNAQDLTALLNALINSALSKLVQLGKNSVSKGLLGIKPANPDINPCEGLTGEDLVDCERGGRETPQPPQPPGGGGQCGSCTCNAPGVENVAAKYRDAVVSTVNQVIAADRASTGGMFDHADLLNGNPQNPKVLNSPAYHNTVVEMLKNQGFLATNDREEEISVRRPQDTFDESYDLILSSGYVRTPFHASTCSPPQGT